MKTIEIEQARRERGRGVLRFLLRGIAGERESEQGNGQIRVSVFFFCFYIFAPFFLVNYYIYIIEKLILTICTFDQSTF